MTTTIDDDQEEQFKVPPVDDDSGLQKKSHHQEIKEITNRIKTSVKQLYRPKKTDEVKDKRKKKEGTSSASNSPKNRNTQVRPEFGAKEPMKIQSKKPQIQIDKPQDESDDEDDEGPPPSGPPREATEEQNSSSSSEDEGRLGHVLGFDGLVDDYDPEEWDMEQSRATVSRLVGSLKASKRTECMHRLNNWFSSKAKEIQEGSSLLEQCEGECEQEASNFYVGGWSAGKNIERAIEEKEVKAIKVLNKFYKSLRNQVKIKRSRFAKTRHKNALNNAAAQKAADAQAAQAGAAASASPKSVRISRKTQEESDEEEAPYEDDDEDRFLGSMKGVPVEELRQRLGEKEQEVREMIAEGEACAAEGGPENALTEVTTDLLEIISMQQEDLAHLHTESEVSFKKLQTAKSAAEYLTAQQVKGENNTNRPDEPVAHLLSDLERQIRNDRRGAALDGQKKIATGRTVELKDENEEEIQRQVDTLRKMIADVEEDMERLSSSGAYDELCKATVTQMSSRKASGSRPSDAASQDNPIKIDREQPSSPTGKDEPSPQSPKSMQSASEKKKEKSEEVLKLEEQIARLDKVIPQAERAIEALEGYRQAFADADKESNNILFEDIAELNENGPAGERSPKALTSSMNPLSGGQPLQAEINQVDDPLRDEERRKEIMGNDHLLKQEHNKFERSIANKKQLIQDEIQKQNDMIVSNEDLRVKIKELTKQIEGGAPAGIEACNNEISKLQNENARLETKVAQLAQEIEDEARRAQLEEDMAGGLMVGSDDEKDAAAESRDKFPSSAPPVTLAANPGAATRARRKSMQEGADGEAGEAGEANLRLVRRPSVAQGGQDAVTSAQAGQDAVTSAQAREKDASPASGGAASASAPASGGAASASATRSTHKDVPAQKTSAGAPARKTSSGHVAPPVDPFPEDDRNVGVPDEKMEKMKTQQHADMAELLKLQQENVEIADQIDEIENKIKALKSSKGKPNAIEEVLGNKEDKAEEPPPEVLELRKELRKKQRALNSLRKRWWNEKAESAAAKKQMQRAVAAMSAMRKTQVGGNQAPSTGTFGGLPLGGDDGAEEAAVRIAAVPAHVHFNRVRHSLGGLGVGITAIG